MSSTAVAQNIAFVNWTVLFGLALGMFAVVALTRLRTDATRGFLSFTGVCAIVAAVLAWFSDGGLPTTVADSPVQMDPAWDGPRRLALAAFIVLAVAFVIAIRRGRRGAPLAIAGLVAGMAVLVTGALTWGGGRPDALAFLAQQTLLALVTGGVVAAMILGHWYLVTPKLPEAPLIAVSRLLLGLLIAIAVLSFVFVATGWGVPGSDPGGSQPFAILVGPWALFVWLRLIIGLAFPLVVSWMALQTAKTRSMESATGLLYINVGSVAAGTILAAGVFFGGGLFI